MAGRIRAKRTQIDGFWFDSGAEARRYQELRLMQAGGLIRDLEVHPQFPIKVNGRKICRYIADFRFTLADGSVIVEDVKGVETDVFRLKAKLFGALYKIPLVITPAADYRAPGPRTARSRLSR